MCNKEWSLCHQNAIDDEWFEINVFCGTFTERRWKYQVNKQKEPSFENGNDNAKYWNF